MCVCVCVCVRERERERAWLCFRTCGGRAVYDEREYGRCALGKAEGSRKVVVCDEREHGCVVRESMAMFQGRWGVGKGV